MIHYRPLHMVLIVNGYELMQRPIACVMLCGKGPLRRVVVRDSQSRIEFVIPQPGPIRIQNRIEDDIPWL